MKDMKDINEIINEILKIYDLVVKNNEDIRMQLDPVPIAPVPDGPKFGLLDEGKNIQDISESFRKYCTSIQENKELQDMTRGLSGTKNELLRDLVVSLDNLICRLHASLDEYVLEYINSMPNETLTQQDINKLIKYSGKTELDPIALFRLRKFVYENPEADYVQLAMTQKNLQIGQKILRSPLDRFGIIQKSILSRQELETNIGPIDKIIESTKNIIIISRNGPGYYFKSYENKPGDVQVPINTDFIKRTQTVVRVPGSSGLVNDILHLPGPGKLVSIYETYDYETFFFMTTGLHVNLVPYRVAIGYYFAQKTSKSVPENVQIGPNISHEAFNNVSCSLFDERYYRHDIALLANDYKFGQGLSGSLREEIKNRLFLVADAGQEAVLQVNIPSLIRESVNSIMPPGTSRESNISSYLGTIRLVSEFDKEYKMSVRDSNWDSHPRLSMTDVFNKCDARITKIGAWTIDHKSPKDMFFD